MEAETSSPGMIWAAVGAVGAAVEWPWAAPRSATPATAGTPSPATQPSRRVRVGEPRGSPAGASKEPAVEEPKAVASQPPGAVASSRVEPPGASASGEVASSGEPKNPRLPRPFLQRSMPSSLPKRARARAPGGMAPGSAHSLVARARAQPEHRASPSTHLSPRTLRLPAPRAICRISRLPPLPSSA